VEVAAKLHLQRVSGNLVEQETSVLDSCNDKCYESDQRIAPPPLSAMVFLVPGTWDRRSVCVLGSDSKVELGRHKQRKNRAKASSRNDKWMTTSVGSNILEKGGFPRKYSVAGFRDANCASLSEGNCEFAEGQM
jgi:hypothetical protein